MSNSISLFPKLTNKHIDKMELYKSKMEFWYEEEGNEFKIDIEDSGNNINLVDKSHRWDFKLNNLIIKKSFLFNPKPLFGYDGIAHVDSTLGMALLWESSESLQRGVSEIGEFKSDTDEVNLNLYYKFPKNSFRKEINTKIIIYLKSNPIEYNKDKYNYATIPGTILGEISSKKLVVDGQGGQFPTTEIDDKNQPLWSLACKWDSLEDSLDDSVMLYLNKAHKDYPKLDLTDNKTYNEDLVKEMMIEVVFLIIINAVIDGDYQNMEDDYIEGSVGDLINYYKRVYNIDSNVPEEIRSKISIGVRK